MACPPQGVLLDTDGAQLLVLLPGVHFQEAEGAPDSSIFLEGCRSFNVCEGVRGAYQTPLL